MPATPYRLGLDIGTNSIGWTLLDLEPLDEDRFRPIGIRAMGVRIFPDGRVPKDETSLAKTRREARSARRRRDRYIARRTNLIHALVRMGLMPQDEKERRQLAALNPYQLRARAVREPLSPFFLGRALYHLNQRRGFRSNRKTASKDEMKKIGPEIENLRQQLQFKTLGEYCWERFQNKEPVRAREGVHIYPARDMVEEEFRRIRETQAPHQTLSPEDWKELEEIIFHQRPLKPVEPGYCWVYPDQHRAPRALPSFFRFTIAQNLHDLKLTFVDQGRKKEKLNAEQRETLWTFLNSHQKLKFDDIPKKLKLEGVVECNLETERRRELKGNPTAVLLSKKEYFGKSWFKLDDATQDEVVLALLDKDTEALVRQAMEDWGLPEENARRLAELTPEDITKESFSKGYARFCKQALQELVALMRDQGQTYDKAMKKMGKHPSDNLPEPNLDFLEYYGKLLPEAVVGTNPEAEAPSQGRPDKILPEEIKRYGRIPNPTVHIGLNQLHHLVNALIREYGKPAEIIVELVRDLKQTREQKKEITREQTKNQDENRRIDRELEQLDKAPNRDNRIKFKLWEELAADPNDRCCPFSGVPIPRKMLFNSDIEVEHLLPWALTLDDSIHNKTVCTKKANQLKKRRAPYEAFGGPDSPYPYPEILERVRNLPKRKRWRFDPDAMEKFQDEEKFLDRALNDTAYLARIAKKYLAHICPHEKIWVVPGRLTAFLRYRWGLDGVLGKRGIKNRDDHRHHAVDALVAALTDRGLLQKVRQDNQGRIEKFEVPHPFGMNPEQFVATVKKVVDAIVVSHRPEHGLGNRLHEDTAYGPLKNPTEWEREQGYNVVYRKPVSGITKREIHAVRDPLLRRSLVENLEGLKGKEFKAQLALWAQRRGIRRLRILKKENPLIEIRHRQGEREHVKCLVPGEIHHVGFWQMPDGRIAGKGVNYFDANTRHPNEHRPHPAARLLFKVHKGDMLILNEKGENRILKVHNLKPSNRQLVLGEHHEGGKLKERHDNSNDQFRFTFFSFSKLKEKQVRKVHVDILGRVRDPGPLP